MALTRKNRVTGKQTLCKSRFFYEYLFSLVIITPTKPHTHFKIDTTLTKRSNLRSLETCTHSNAIDGAGSRVKTQQNGDAAT
jgi:hypothetical protein